MPTLLELRSRYTSDAKSTLQAASGEESLVADVRGGLRPAQMVEEKLRSILQVGTRWALSGSVTNNSSRRPG